MAADAIESLVLEAFLDAMHRPFPEGSMANDPGTMNNTLSRALVLDAYDEAERRSSGSQRSSRHVNIAAASVKTKPHARQTISTLPLKLSLGTLSPQTIRVVAVDSLCGADMILGSDFLLASGTTVFLGSVPPSLSFACGTIPIRFDKIDPVAANCEVSEEVPSHEAPSSVPRPEPAVSRESTTLP